MLGVPVVATVHSLWTGREGWVRIIGAIAGWDRLAGAVDRGQCQRLPRRCAARSVRTRRVRRRPQRRRRGLVVRRAPAVQDASRPVTFVSVMRLAGRKRPLQLLEAFATARLAVPADACPPAGDRGRRSARAEGAGPDRRTSDSTGASSSPAGSRADEIRDLYRRADGYVAPSHQESFGIAALEARAAGLPVVAMRQRGRGRVRRPRHRGPAVRGRRGPGPGTRRTGRGRRRSDAGSPRTTVPTRRRWTGPRRWTGSRPPTRTPPPRHG